ncbi:MAG: N-acetylmuramoyl-L-alanine amidase [Bacteroidetes bacterium]|nr:N-acetylmuramoyl-L-alanine amidase [Bacteroidota bacterium]
MPHYLYYTLIFDGAKLQNPNVKSIFRIISVIVIVLLTLSSAAPRKDSYKIKTVVIDAGHGGHDAGCLGASAREKHVALDIALKLGKQIESTFPDVKVVYTRKTDVFIPLHERANIANKAHADLFICIHLNAGGKGAYGAETFIMGNHKTEDNLEVAKRENSAILLEEDYQKKYDGFDPNSPEANIIFSLYQSQFMNQSLLFASNIQEEFTDYAGRYNRGVKQAGFLVLYKTAMPAVLIECGFLTHEPEEKFLASEKGQQVMAASIFRAFKEYKVDMESGNDSPQKSTPAPVSTTPVPAPKSTSTPDPVVSQPVKGDSTPVVKDAVPPLKDKQVVADSGPGATVGELKIDDSPEKEPVPAPVKPAPSKAPENSVESPVFIAVQIGASKNPAIDNKKYLQTTGVKAITSGDGFTRYVIGNFTNLAAAKKKLSEIKSTLNPDAFLTAFNGKQRISLQEAEALLKRP